MTDALHQSLLDYNREAHLAFEAQKTQSASTSPGTYPTVNVREYRVKTSWSGSPAVGDIVERVTTYSTTGGATAILAVWWRNELGQLVPSPPSYSLVDPGGTSDASSLNQLAMISYLDSIDTRLKANRAVTVDDHRVALAWSGSPVNGSKIKRLMTWNLATTPVAVVDTQWFSNGLLIPAPPGDANVVPDAVPLVPAATASNQLTQIGLLSDIANRSGVYDNYKVQQVDTSISGTAYIRKASANDDTAWLIVKRVVSLAETTITYAGKRNNPSILSAASAWASKTTLTYGDVGRA